MQRNTNNRDLNALARAKSVFDVFVILACFTLVHKVYLDDIDFTVERLLVLVFSAAASYTILSLGGLYSPSQARHLSEELVKIAVCWFLVALTVGLFVFLAKVAGEVSRMWFGWSMVLSYLAMVSYRAALRYSLIWSRKKGHNHTSVVVVGAGELGEVIVKRALESSANGFRVAGVFDNDTSEGHEIIDECKVLGKIGELTNYIEKMRKEGQPVEQVWITLPMQDEALIQKTAESLENTSVDVCIIPSLFTLKVLTGSSFQVGELPVVNISDVTLPNFGEWYKILSDFMVSAVAIVIFLPVMVVIAFAIKYESSGPIIFRQRRYGMDGQEIEVWKFRSMGVQEDGDKVVQAQKNDPRVTRVGAFLRRTSLDELPQFFNVLQGSMSVVGPRPHAVSHNEEYRTRIDGYMMRHKIKPGITGLAQVNGWRGETDTLEKMEQRVNYDLEYIRTWSPWLDFKIMVRTVLHGLTGNNVY